MFEVSHALESLKLNLLLNWKTGDPLKDMIFAAIISGLVTILFSQFNHILEYTSLKKLKKHIDMFLLVLYALKVKELLETVIGQQNIIIYGVDDLMLYGTLFI